MTRATWPGVALALASALGASACGGAGGVATEPREPPVLRVVGCQPAPMPAQGAFGGVGVPSRVFTEGSSNGFDYLLDDEPPPAPPPSPRKGPRARVVLGMPSVASSAVPAAEVARVLRAAIPSFTACFDAMPQRPASLKATLALTIGPTGNVVSAAATTTGTQRTSITPCLTRASRTLRFTAPLDRSFVKVSLPLLFEAVAGPRADAARAAGDPPRLWTPFATVAEPPPESAPTVARAAEVGLRGRLATLEACFPAPAPVGSLRAMLVLAGDGALVEARVGGLGDATVETCVQQALAGLRVVTPTADSVELACDLSRGNARPWRISTDAGYGVLTATRAQIAHEGQTITPGAADPAPLAARPGSLVIAEPEAPGAILELALTWAFHSQTTLLALRTDAGAPLLLGVARSIGARRDSVEAAVHTISLEVGPRAVTACLHGRVHDAPLAEPAAVGALIRRLADRCAHARCAPTVTVALEGATPARELVEVLGTLRHAGFEQVLIGGAVGCRAADEPR